MSSNFPWSGIGDTSCSLRAARRRLATAVMLTSLEKEDKKSERQRAYARVL